MKAGENFSKKLLVEGKDDQHIVWALCEKYNITENFDVIDCEGIENLMVQLPVWMKESGIQTIGIIADADVDIQKRLEQVNNALQKSGIQLPGNIPSSGLISETKPRVAIWIMPDNKNSGALEDFIKLLIPPNDSLLEYAENTISEIESKNIQKYKPQHRSKALVHTWLAWQDEPGCPMGLSITNGNLDSEAGICKQLVDWLKRTFE